MTKAKEKVYIGIILVLIAASAQSYYSFAYAPTQQIEVYYNQEHALNEKLINTIRDADKFVYFAVYTFTRYDLKDALLAAKYRGLEVKGIMDKKQNRDVELQREIFNELKNAGVEIYEQDHASIMHLKVLVTEKAYASGSFNWTSAATNLNDEVLEIGRDQNIRQQYQNILEKMFEKYK